MRRWLSERIDDGLQAWAAVSEKAQRRVMVVALFLLVMLGAAVCGCSVQFVDGGLDRVDVFQLPPGDEIQANTITRIGIQTDLSTPGVNVGYERVQVSRVPVFTSDVTQSAVIPDVLVETRVNGDGAAIGERLKVGNAEAVPDEQPEGVELFPGFTVTP